jgi:hypothetical protein
LYVVNPVMVYPANATNAAVPMLTKGRIVLTNWDSSGPHQAFFFDPQTAASLGKSGVAATNGVMSVPLPEFQEDLFIRIDAAPTLHSTRITPGNVLNFIEFHVNGESGGIYRLGISTNLSDWQNWRQFTNATGDDAILDNLLEPRRFFRAEIVE